MNNNEIISRDNTLKDEGYKVIEVNISDSTENLYAVCTPIKMQ